MYEYLRQLLFEWEPEEAHEAICRLGKLVQLTPVNALLARNYRVKDERLRVKVFNFENPVGLAAGFDKNALLVNFFYGLGFGFTEVGSVTAQSCDGNERPRLFRLENDGALVNRMGLNNEGADQIFDRLKGKRKYPVGVNIAKTNKPEIFGDKAIEDFLYSFERLQPVADYITLNISCPNTREKTFEDPSVLEILLQEVQKIKEKPVLVKKIKVIPAWRWFLQKETATK